MTEPTETPAEGEPQDRPTDQSWLEMENIRGGDDGAPAPRTTSRHDYRGQGA
jgi:hypothetical protein